MVTIALTIYAYKTKVDLSVFTGLAFVIYLAMFPMMVIGMIIKISMFKIIINLMGILFYSIYLIIDTQMILGLGDD